MSRTSDQPINRTWVRHLVPRSGLVQCRLCRIRHKRHRFAVQTLVRWYRTGKDVERRLPVLSTYLGHAHVTDTYWYLTSTPELMGAAGKRMEERWGGLL